MYPFHILITEEQYGDDETGREKTPLIYFDERIFANTKRGAIKKAIILSKIPIEKVEKIEVYVSDFEYVSDYGEDS